VKTVIHWFRRDLRLSDNTALSQAAQEADVVVPVFILEPALRTGPDVGAARLAFLLRSVEALRISLEKLGCPLVIREGASDFELPKLALETGAEAVFCNRRYEPYARARDQKVARELDGLGIRFRAFKDAVIWEDREVLTGAGQPYTVFTPYSKSWKRLPIPPPWPAPAFRGRYSASLKSTDLPLDPAAFGFPLSQSVPEAGEAAGLDALRRFAASAVREYAARRDFPAQPGTSMLSPHLRAGTVGIRAVFAQLAPEKNSAPTVSRESFEKFEGELIWREFFLQILANFPHVSRSNFNPRYDRVEWPGTDAHRAAWEQGRTGYPIVDAAMRCLNATGWMHNRLRMITAMFLTKDLLVDWRRGERYFMRQLVDGDMAANNGGWQWSAGTGADAAPYFRIFNPVSQGLKFDPKGEFVRRWVPELAAFRGDAIHEPWENPLAARKAGYPDRIVIHSEQRDKWLALAKP